MAMIPRRAHARRRPRVPSATFPIHSCRHSHMCIRWTPANLSGILGDVSIDYSTPWHPRSYPASAITCRVCARKFQAGHVPAGDPLCAECAAEAAEAQPGLFPAPESEGGPGLL